eukprot:3879673-Pleurochrysis_carterae.AAC.2
MGAEGGTGGGGHNAVTFRVHLSEPKGKTYGRSSSIDEIKQFPEEHSLTALDSACEVKLCAASSTASSVEARRRKPCLRNSD